MKLTNSDKTNEERFNRRFAGVTLVLMIAVFFCASGLMRMAKTPEHAKKQTSVATPIISEAATQPEQQWRVAWQSCWGFSDHGEWSSDYKIVHKKMLELEKHEVNNRHWVEMNNLP